MSVLKTIHECLDAGDKEAARDLLIPYLRDDSNSAEAWWLMARAVDDPAEQVDHLKRALQINPRHEQAMQMLAEVRSRGGHSTSAKSKSATHTKIDYPVVHIPLGPVIGVLSLTVIIGLVAMGVYQLFAGIDDGFHRSYKESISRSMVMPGQAPRVPAPRSDYDEMGNIRTRELEQGSVGNTSDDMWLFSGEAGQRVTIRARDIGGDLDPRLHLISPSGEQVAFNDDRTQRTFDAEIVATLPETGDYQIFVGAMVGYEKMGGAYRLSIR